MCSCEYREIFKKTYFEEHLRTVPSDIERNTKYFIV